MNERAGASEEHGDADVLSIPVSAMATGSVAIVRKVDGGSGLIQRLSAMGILPGVCLKLVRGNGPVIVEVKGARMVLGRGVVSRIRVEPLGRSNGT